MMPIATDVALALGSSSAASIIAKVTVVLAMTLVGVRLARTTRAAVRHVLLAATFAVLLALPVASMVIPSVSLVAVPTMAGRITESPASPHLTDSTRRVAEPVSAVSGERAMITSFRLSPSAFLLTGWAIGVLVFLSPVLVGLRQIRTLRQVGRSWHYGQSVVQQLAADADIHRHVEVLLHDVLSGPVSGGVVRPMIVLPMDAQTWNADDLSRAIIHELEHVRRGDWVSQCLARAVCACYWFHPLVWIAWRQLRLEAERACDDAVLRCAEATAYADQLIALADRLSRAPNRPLLAMANRTDLKARVFAVLDSRQARGRAGTFFPALVCVASALLVTTISPLRIVTAAQIPAGSQTLVGSLIDPLGRILPDARLTLWNVSTQQPIETQSDRNGRFNFGGIPPGEYRLQVQGFGLQGGITLSAGQHVNRDIAVVMGGPEYAVTVSSSAAQTVLPPVPSPLPAPSRTSEAYSSQTDLDRCAQASMFCRVTPPVQIARVQPMYPAKQRESRVAGRVVVEGRVGTDGLVRDLRVLEPADPDFGNATVDALRYWQFTPIQLDGIPVDMSIRVTANFVVR